MAGLENTAREQSPDPAGFLDRATGAFLGLAVGDALGATLEFEPRDAHPALTKMVGGGAFSLQPGQWTDDTSMALCIADALIERGSCTPTDVAERLVGWWLQGKNCPGEECFDIGGTTRLALERYIDKGFVSPVFGPNAAGNAGLVRTAPVAIVFAGSTWDLYSQASLQCGATHGELVCVQSSIYLAEILGGLMMGLPFDEALRPNSPPWDHLPEITELRAGAWRTKTRDQIRSGGYVIDTFEAALWSVATSTTFEQAVVTAVNLAGDADSVGAVAGQLAGARWGAWSIPNRWLKTLAWREHLTERVVALLKRRHRLRTEGRLRGRIKTP